MNTIFDEDLQRIQKQAGAIWQELDNSHIFLTGGTGFFGRWLLHSMKHAIDTIGLNIRITILTRNPESFGSEEPDLETYSRFHFLSGDIRDFSFPRGEFTHLIHGAADSSDHVLRSDPLRMFNSIVLGANRVLDFATDSKIPRILFLSSGAVFGDQSSEFNKIPDDWEGKGLDCLNIRNAYAEAKRTSEMLCTIYQDQFGLNISIARCFAFLGPYLPLDANYAIGNFISDVLGGRTIMMKGDGSEVRSYLYASDLVVWLWTLLARGEPGETINVGSDDAISINNVAKEVARTLGVGDVSVQGDPGKQRKNSRYVPSVVRAREKYGLSSTVSISDAIWRTAIWYGWKPLP